MIYVASLNVQCTGVWCSTCGSGTVCNATARYVVDKFSLLLIIDGWLLLQCLRAAIRSMTVSLTNMAPATKAAIHSAIDIYINNYGMQMNKLLACQSYCQ